MDQDTVNRLLRESSNSELESKLKTEIKSYIKSSSDTMSQYWSNWEEADQNYRAFRFLDEEDVKDKSRGKPNKIIVPITYAQIQTGLSFIYSTFLQRDTLFELKGRGPEDQTRVLGIERDLQYQIEQSQFMLKLYNWCLSAMKHGFGVVKTSWDTRYETVRTSVPETPGMFQRLNSILGKNTPTKYRETLMDILAYEGTGLETISAYNFYPDPSVSLSRFQEGAFVAHEEEYSLQAVRGKEGNLYHGTDQIDPRISHDLYNERKRYVGKGLYREFDTTLQQHKASSVSKVIVTEITLSIIPREWSEKLQIDLGKEPYPVKYIATMVNDNKIIRFEPLGYIHNQFNYALFEWSPDSTCFINPGLAETISELQNLINWFFNSHVANVKAVIKNRFLGVEDKIYKEDIDSNRSLIRVRGSSMDVNRVLQQLNVQDVTRGHVADVSDLLKIVQLVTGINDNALGQYASGRRSATESRNVNAGAAARLKMHASLFWSGGLEPLGRQMLSNTRQLRSKEMYENILGDDASRYPYEQTILSSPDKTAGGYDFAPFDATLPSDKQSMINPLTELFKITLENGEVSQALNVNPKPLLEYLMQLHGIRNMSQFNFSQTAGESQSVEVASDERVRELSEAGSVEGIPNVEDILNQLGKGQS